MNPLLALVLAVVAAFVAGAMTGVMYMPGVAARDSERIDLLEALVRRDLSVDLRAELRTNTVGVHVTARGWKWRATLRGAIDAHKNGEAAVIEEAKVPTQKQPQLRTNP